METTMIIQEDWPPEKRPRIVAMTAHALKGDREKYLACGMEDYVSKPVRVEKLIEVLQRCPSQKVVGSLLGEKDDEFEETAVSHPPTNNDQQQTAPPQITGSWPIDLAGVRLSLGEDAEEMLAELIPMYLEDIPPLLSQLENAAADGQAGKLRKAAHIIKGSSASLGLKTVAELAQEIEYIGRDNKMIMATTRVREFKLHYAEIEAALISQYEKNS